MRRLILAITITFAQSCAILPMDDEPEYFDQPQSTTSSWEDIDQHLQAQREHKQETARELAAQRGQMIASALEEKDITLGMSIDQVMAVWGDPRDVDYAGQPGTGNERWTYSEGITSPRHGLARGRIIYFEDGQVSGWETSD